jgi:hypothetical protein
MPDTAAFRGWKAQDAIEWFHGIGRLVRSCAEGPRAGPEKAAVVSGVLRLAQQLRQLYGVRAYRLYLLSSLRRARPRVKTSQQDGENAG